MKKIAFILIILFATRAHALLPPFYQSVKEIESILQDERFINDANSAYPILEIKKVEGGYLIITSGYHQFVEINYILQDMIGPAKFELKFHEKNCLDSWDV
ncbi:hypothetical protein LCGC14_0991960 [marine sediment metagenome]|uniref:Uncharacterized protein n=1 Tax=marine sediment metagenome TaxID=412755 RepID=A0A0F9QP07_9ZZZZ